MAIYDNGKYTDGGSNEKKESGKNEGRTRSKDEYEKSETNE